MRSYNYAVRPLSGTMCNTCSRPEATGRVFAPYLALVDCHLINGNGNWSQYVAYHSRRVI